MMDVDMIVLLRMTWSCRQWVLSSTRFGSHLDTVILLLSRSCLVWFFLLWSELLHLFCANNVEKEHNCRAFDKAPHWQLIYWHHLQTHIFLSAPLGTLRSAFHFHIWHLTHYRPGRIGGYRVRGRGRAVVGRRHLAQVVVHRGASLSWSHNWVPCFFWTLHRLQCLGWPFDHLLPTPRTRAPPQLYRYGVADGPLYT